MWERKRRSKLLTAVRLDSSERTTLRLVTKAKSFRSSGYILGRPSPFPYLFPPHRIGFSHNGCPHYVWYVNPNPTILQETNLTRRFFFFSTIRRIPTYRCKDHVDLCFFHFPPDDHITPWQQNNTRELSELVAGDFLRIVRRWCSFPVLTPAGFCGR